MLSIAGLAVLAAPSGAAPGTVAKLQQPSAAAPGIVVKLQQPSAAAPSHCPRTTMYQAYDGGKAAQPRKLAELPGAHQFAAVYRTVNGCEVPLVVRYNIGG
jgi:hypothetical protein